MAKVKKTAEICKSHISQEAYDELIELSENLVDGGQLPFMDVIESIRGQFVAIQGGDDEEHTVPRGNEMITFASANRIIQQFDDANRQQNAEVIKIFWSLLIYFFRNKTPLRNY